jgi:hypothetical protein
MNPEVIRVGQDGTSREVWRFIFLDWYSRGLYLEHYKTQSKIRPQRKWRTTGHWDRYDHRNDTIKDVPLPDDVIAEVRQQLKDAIDKLPVRKE